MPKYEPRELTPTFVADLAKAHKASGSNARIEVRDTRVPGLAIRIGPRSATWFVSLKFQRDGKQVKRAWSLGEFPDMTVPAARKAAEAKRGDRTAKGAAMAAPKPDKAPTLRGAFDRWLAAGTNGDPFTKQLRPRTVGWANQLIDVPLADYASRPLPWFFDPANLKDMADAIRAQRTPNVAAKCVELVRMVGNWTADIYGQREGLPSAMPRVRRGRGAKPPPRDTDFEGDELPALYTAMCDLGPVQRDAWIFAALTGQRSAVVESMQWTDYDGAAKTLTIEAEREGNKAVRTYRIPVSAPVASLLERRRQENAVLFDGSPYIFPTKRRSCGHIDFRREENFPTPRRRLAQLAKQGSTRGASGCGPHAMKHTFAEHATKELGVSESDVNILTGMTPMKGALSAYAGKDGVSDRLRAVTESISAHMLKCFGLPSDHRFTPDIREHDAGARAA